MSRDKEQMTQWCTRTCVVSNGQSPHCSNMSPTHMHAHWSIADHINPNNWYMYHSGGVVRVTVEWQSQITHIFHIPCNNLLIDKPTIATCTYTAEFRVHSVNQPRLHTLDCISSTCKYRGTHITQSIRVHVHML